jgi:hypothetical protein
VCGHLLVRAGYQALQVRNLAAHMVLLVGPCGHPGVPWSEGVQQQQWASGMASNNNSSSSTRVMHDVDAWW